MLNPISPGWAGLPEREIWGLALPKGLGPALVFTLKPSFADGGRCIIRGVPTQMTVAVAEV